MAVGRRSWKSAWVAGGGLLLVPLTIMLWLGLCAPPGGAGAGAERPTPSGPNERPMAQSPDGRAPGSRVLVGTVTGADDQAIDGARVSIEGRGGAHAVTDGLGRYRLAVVPLSAAMLIVSAEGYQPARLSVGAAAGRTSQTVDVQLARLSAVAGVVIDPAGEPLPGAFVGCVEPGGESPLPTAVSGAAGAFELSAAAAGCSAVASHGQWGDSPRVVLRAGSENTLQLVAGASIEGVAVDEEGRVVSAYAISVESYRAAQGEPAERAAAGRQRLGRAGQVTAESGEFLIDRLRTGHYVLAASAPGRPPVRTDDIFLAPGESVRDIRLVLASGGTLRGRIDDAVSGEPIEGARVALDALSTTRDHRVPAAAADGDGRYLLAGVPRDSFSVRISARGYRSRVVAGLESSAGGPLELDVSLAPVGDGGANETEYTGIGAVLAATPAGVIVAALIEGGAAQRAGLERKDRIVRIDGRAAEGWSLPMCVQQLRGRSGSRVSLTVMREHAGEVEIVVTRESFVR